MCFKEICQLGIKVLAAGLTAAAVFFGIGKLGEKKKKAVNNPEGEESKVEESSRSAEGDNRFESSWNNDNNNNNFQPMAPQQETNGVIAGLKKTQDICGKLFAVFQSLTTVVENLTRIFNGGGSSYYDQPYFNQGNPWCYYSQQPVQMDNGTVWTRLSPYIVAAGPNPNNFNNNNGFNNNRNHYSI